MTRRVNYKLLNRFLGNTKKLWNSREPTKVQAYTDLVNKWRLRVTSRKTTRLSRVDIRKPFLSPVNKSSTRRTRWRGRYKKSPHHGSTTRTRRLSTAAIASIITKTESISNNLTRSLARPSRHPAVSYPMRVQRTRPGWWKLLLVT